MADVRFYHLTRSALEQVLPDLLEKTLARGWRAVVLTGSAERAEALAQQLWTYRADSFLPHGTAKDGDAAEQPIWLTHHDENPNGAQVLFLLDGMRTRLAPSMERVCDLFDGNDPEAVAAARQRWAEVKQEGHVPSYWQQDARGGWEDKTPR